MSIHHGVEPGDDPNSTESRARFSPSRRTVTRLLAVAGVAVMGLLPLSVNADAQSKDTGDLNSAVLAAMGQKSAGESIITARDSGRTQVNVMRTSEDGNWKFGSAVIEAPNKEGYYPQGWLFVADESNGKWDVSLEGSDGFTDKAADAPDGVVSEEESRNFAAAESPTITDRAASPTVTGLMLPWKKGKIWKFTGGPHGFNTGYDRPFSSLDFAGAGADQKVRAASKGKVYTMCGNNKGWIRIYHPSGNTTSYYHLRNNIRPVDGARITRGVVIGETGNDVSCGGASYGRHVHFSLMRGDRFVPLDNKSIGGWTFQEGSAYNGFATHKGTRRNPGSTIRNFGS